jgi:hypothetical protein
MLYPEDHQKMPLIGGPKNKGLRLNDLSVLAALVIAVSSVLVHVSGIRDNHGIGVEISRHLSSFRV